MQTIGDLNDLRFIAAIHAAGSLQGAAKRLGVNHATVFRRLAALEARLQVRLFERSGGRYSATLAGAELAQAGALIEQHGEDALRKVAGKDVRAVGEVRITSTETLAMGLLMPILADCQRQYSGITLQLTISNQMNNLSKREADIAIRPTTNPPEHLIGKRLGTLAFAAYATPAYLQGAGERPLGEHAWIALDESLPGHRSLKWLAQITPLETLALRCNSILGIGQACRAGLGVALLPCFMADQDPELRRLTPVLPECSSELWLLMHPDLRHMARVRCIFQIIDQHLTALTPRIAGAVPHSRVD